MSNANLSAAQFGLHRPEPEGRVSDKGVEAAKKTADSILQKWNEHPETDPTKGHR